jgi:hypothetical protein
MLELKPKALVRAEAKAARFPAVLERFLYLA